MTATDYLLNGVLVALVIRQVRGRRLTPKQFVWPLAIVAWAAFHYLHGIPTAGNDLVLAIGGALLGIALGTGAGYFTSITPDENGVPIAKASGIAAALWVLGVGSRMAFSLYAEHGGGPAIGRFSAAHNITSGEAWVAALILMSFGEVLARSVFLAVRSGVFSELLQRLFQDRQPVLQ